MRTAFPSATPTHARGGSQASRFSDRRDTFTTAGSVAVAIGVVAPAVAFALAASPGAGVVWLLATAPGLCYVIATEWLHTRTRDHPARPMP